MNTPNKLSILRIALVPIMMFFYLSDYIPYGIGKYVAVLLFIAAALTDRLDGYLARKNNQVTDLGKLLDPIADKMLITCGFLLIIIDGTVVSPVGIICFTILFARDTLVNMLRQVGATKGYVFAATLSGKLKAIFQYIHIPLFMFIAGLSVVLPETAFASGLMLALNIVAYTILIVATCVTTWSAIDYTIQNIKLSKQNDIKKAND